MWDVDNMKLVECLLDMFLGTHLRIPTLVIVMGLVSANFDF